MSFYQFNFLSSYFFNGITLGVLAFFVYLKNTKNPKNYIFSIYLLSIVWWSVFSIFMLLADNEGRATFWDRVCLVGVVFIPTTFLHFTLIFLRLEGVLKKLIKLCYLFSFIFLVLDFTPLFIKKTAPIYQLSYFTVPGPGYLVFLVYYTVTSLFSFVLLFRKLISEKKGLYRQQLMYFFAGTVLSYIAGVFNYNLVLKIPPYSLVPWANYLVGIYGIIIAYTIVKYRLMDIQLVMTRAGIFIVVYALVLGVPIGVGLKIIGIGLWLVPVLLMAVFSAIGPFVYLFFQRKAEERLLQEQRSYQATLHRASLGMGQIKDLGKLVKLIVHVVSRSVRLERAAIYVFHEDSNKYVLKARKGVGEEKRVLNVIDFEAPLIGYLKKNREPLVVEELVQRSRENSQESFKWIVGTFQALSCEVVIPAFIENRLIAIVVLGKKRSRKIFTEDDLSVFSILANQTALAIENALYYDKTQKTTEQLFRAEKMATIGTMADGLSHQINNRFHSMGFVAGDAIDTVNLELKKNHEEDVKAVFEDLKYSLGRIQENVKRGGEIVSGLLRYTRKGAEGIEPVDLNELLDASIEMAQFKIKLNQFKLVRSFSEDIPKLRGNFTQLQEVFFNVIDNAYDAMMQRKRDLEETDYQAKLEFFVEVENEAMMVIVKDNGIGIKAEDLQKIFTPFFTTKASAKKGTGLGMYVIRQIIEDNHGGKVSFDSKYKEGTTIRLQLPRA